MLLPAESPLLAAHFTREMDRLWRGAELGINGRLQRKRSRQQTLCAGRLRQLG